MGQFRLEEYLKHPSRKVETRDGREVRILCTDRKHEDGFCVVGLVPDGDYGQGIYAWTKDGVWDLTFEHGRNDLLLAPVKRTGYVNVFSFPLTPETRTDECIYDTFQEAENFAKRSPDSKYYRGTVEIEWEE